MRRDHELACDAAVLLRRPLTARFYARTLLKTPLEGHAYRSLSSGWLAA